MTKIILSALAVLALLYIGSRAFAVVSAGYSWSEMDWNSDGTTSITEMFAASDIGKRTAEKDGKKCVEYYAYKDGLPVKIVCQK